MNGFAPEVKESLRYILEHETWGFSHLFIASIKVDCSVNPSSSKATAMMC